MQIPIASNNQNIWLSVGNLIDGISDKPMKNAHVVYNRDGFVFVGDHLQSPPKNLLPPGRNRPNLELPDYTLLPGLIDAHTHLFLHGGELDFNARKEYLKKPSSTLFQLAQTRLERLIRIGILGVRDAGDKHGVGLRLRDLYRQENRPFMPYIDSPGAAIHHRGRYGSFIAEPLENYTDIRECVISRINSGADRIKLIPTGIINFKKGKVTKEPQMTRAELDQFVSVAKEFDRQTFAHASGDAGIELVIESGIDSVEHGYFIRNDQLAKMRDRDIAWVPTFAPVQKQVDLADRMGWDQKTVSNLRKILDDHAASLVKAHELGVRIIAGSDAGSYAVAHGFGFLYELELMEKAGLATLTVINSATGSGSMRLGFSENIGQIKPGYKSRFILTEYDVLLTISNLRKEKHIVFDGQPIPPVDGIDENGM